MLVQLMRGDVYRTEYGAIYLGLAITVVPIIILYAIFARYIVYGGWVCQDTEVPFRKVEHPPVL